jgi:hypothetical protein
MLAGCWAVGYAKASLSVSPGNVTYYVDPVRGDDTRTVVAKDAAWKSIAQLNALKLAPGDQVVIAPGTHTSSLTPSGKGTASQPIVIRFLPGVHENIRIEENFFDGGDISAKSVKGLTIINNRSTAGEVKVSTPACTDVTLNKL